MKRAGVIACWFTFFSLLAAGKAGADDGGPSTEFWVKDDKVACVSIINPEDAAPGSFLLFDYSAAIGQSLGKPWSVMTAGRCYQIDDSGGQIYLIQSADGRDEQYYANYRDFSPDQNFRTDKDTKSVRWYYTDIGISKNDFLHFTGLHAEQLLPTGYIAGYPITSFSSSVEQEFGSMLEDTEYLALSGFYRQMANELETAIRSCDTRKRVEYQLKIQSGENLEISNIIWKLTDGSNYLLDPSLRDTGWSHNPLPASFERLTKMGCRTAFGEYLASHAADFDKFDLLAANLIKKYPGLDETTLAKRPDQDIRLINGFVSGADTPEAAAPTVTPASINTPKPQPVSTVLDEPTPEKKNAYILSFENPLLVLYFLLPVFVVFGAAWFFLTKHRLR